jgi:hypothetical protein
MESPRSVDWRSMVYIWHHLHQHQDLGVAANKNRPPSAQKPRPRYRRPRYLRHSLPPTPDPTFLSHQGFPPPPPHPSLMLETLGNNLVVSTRVTCTIIPVLAGGLLGRDIICFNSGVIVSCSVVFVGIECRAFITFDRILSIHCIRHETGISLAMLSTASHHKTAAVMNSCCLVAPPLGTLRCIPPYFFENLLLSMAVYFVPTDTLSLISS